MQQLLFDFTEATGSIEQQTGWRRGHPQMLLQDVELLLKVSFFDYDLKDPEFVHYAQARGCMNGAGAEGESKAGQWRQWVREHWRKFEEFWAGSDLRLTVGSRTIPDEERRLLWKCIRIARAQLQDCWEIYRNRKAA